MKRLFALLALTGIGVLLVACGGEGSTETDPGSESGSDGDQMESSAPDAEASHLVDAALLQLPDFPLGWRAKADVDDRKQACGDLLDKVDARAEGESEEFAAGEVPSAISAANVFSSEHEAEMAFSVMTGQSVAECYADELQHLVEEDGISSETSFGELNVGDLGSQSAGTQFVIEADAEGTKFDLYVDLIVVRVSSVASIYVFIDAFSPFDTASEEEIVGSAVARVAEATGSDLPVDDLARRAVEAKVASADWPEAWCEARIGLTRDGLVELMGEPTERDSGRIPLIPDIENIAPDPVGSDTWEVAGSDEYNAFYDTDLKVQQLDGPPDIGCAEIRAK
jgi:hypothetical protein